MKLLIVCAIIALSGAHLLYAERIVSLEVRGNDKTSDFVIARLLGYSQGMPLEIELLYRGKRSLEESGLFEDVYIAVVPEEDDYRLVVTVVEATTFYPYFGPQIALGIGDRNTLGLGIDAYAGFRFIRFDGTVWDFVPRPRLFWGGPIAGIALPRIFGLPLDLHVEGFFFRAVQWPHDLVLGDLNRLTFTMTRLFETSAVPVRILYEYGSFDIDELDVKKLSFGLSSDNPHKRVEFWNIMLGSGYSFGDSENYERLRQNLYGILLLDLGYCWGPNEEQNSIYGRVTAQIGYYYRIIGQVYAASQTYVGLTAFGYPPVTQVYFPGQLIWRDKAFNPRHYVEKEVEIGVPLTQTLGLAATPDQAVFTPKLLVRGILGSSGTMGAALGIGLSWKTPIGISLEPQVFIRESAPYIRFNLEF